MPSAIGLRVYRIFFSKSGEIQPVTLEEALGFQDIKSLINVFIEKHSQAITLRDRMRSWYFEPKNEGDNQSINGHIRYGDFGYAADMIDMENQEVVYNRKTTHLQAIPLFYDFWFPESANYGLLASQSFQGRSCTDPLLTAIQQFFGELNTNYTLRTKKIMPTDVDFSHFGDNAVRKVTFYSQKTDPDTASRYLFLSQPDKTEMSLSFRAKNNSAIGRVSDVFPSIHERKLAIAELESQGEFSEASAEIRFGKKFRRVTIFGPSKNVGVIDVTDQVEWNSDGHPTLQSLIKITSDLFSDFYSTLGNNP